MNKHIIRRYVPSSLSLLVLIVLTSTTVSADPLPGRDRPKFSQLPMNATQILNDNGVLDTYMGHDQLSTAYGFEQQPGNIIPQYQGRFMADDFADKLSSPVVHVKWWGSYFNDTINLPVDKFLISFEADVPQGPNNPFSHPGLPLLNQVVNRGALSPGSGTFTEKVIRGPDPILNESLYEYNAELHLGQEFQQLSDTIYWLKITALVDVPPTIQFDPYNPPAGVTRWGWHNRDYTIQNTLASNNIPGPPFPPGENIVGQVGPAVAPTPVWHFQDDAVRGDVRILPGPNGYTTPIVFQPGPPNMQPTNYLDGIDGPGISPVPGAPHIGQFSKDLAFELYTTVPEPSSCMLMLVSLCGLITRRL